MADTSSTFDPATGARLTGTGTTYFDPRNDPNKTLADIQTWGQDRNAGGHSLTNCAGVTDPNGLTLVYKTNSAYDFAAITPAQTLTAATPATVTLSPFPSGITASSPTIHKLRIVDAVGGDEVVTVTAVNVGTSVTFTPALNHASGNWTIQSATAGIQEGILALGTGGYLPLASGTLNVYGAAAIPFSDFTLVGRHTTLALYASSGDINAIRVIGTIGAAVDVTADVNVDWYNSEVSAITLADVSGLSAGDLLYLEDQFLGDTYAGPNTRTYIYAQTAEIKSIVGNDVTMKQPVYIPLVTTHSVHSAWKVSPLRNIRISGISFDGANASGATSAFGVVLQYVTDCVLDNLRFENFTNGGGLNVYLGHNITHTNLYAKNCGTGDYGDLMFSKVSWSTGTNNRSQSASGFGPYYGYGVGMDVVAMASIGATARAVKLAQVGRSVWVNCEGSESGSTGFSATWGCWKNTIVNLKADNNASQGLWFSGCADSYNTVIGVQARGNGTSDISILATANNNTILGYAGPSATVYDDGTNNVIGHAEERWRAATLLNSWANYGGFYREAGYMRDAVGTVHLRGCIKSGSTGTTAFTLPDEPGWRPVANVLRLPAQGVSAYVEIEGSSRNVNVYASDTTFISLDGISFRP